MASMSQLKARIANMQHGRHRWLLALLATFQQTLKRRQFARIYVDEEGYWRSRDSQAEFVSPQLYVRSWQELEESVRDCWCHSYAPKPGDVVIDVGAGVGDEAVVFSRMVGDTGRVIAIEAHPNTYRCLDKTVRLNGLRNVSLVCCAASDRDGEISISDGEDFQTSSIVVGKGAHRIPARRLDDLAEEFNWPDPTLIKINIEGAEDAALQGMEQLLKRTQHVVVSCHDFLATTPDSDPALRTYQAVLARLEAAGFQLAPARHDARPWIRYYVYGTNRHAIGRSNRGGAALREVAQNGTRDGSGVAQ